MHLFNKDWKFHHGDVPEAQAAGFPDGDWRTVALPHDWGIEGPFDQKWASATGFLPGGIGWYRKTFGLPAEFASKRVFLHFDGVYANSTVWINGHFLGHRPNGFVSFRYDLTPYLNQYGDNIVAVRADHSQFADARWYTGSGLSRNVYLGAVHPVHLKLWGVFVTTPTVTAENAVVSIETTMENQTEISASVQVEQTLLAPTGQVVAAARAELDVPAGGEQTVTCELAVPMPILWSPESPELYTLRTVVQQAGETLDAEETNVGIRTIRFDADSGFFLNEQSLKLKGVCLHDDAGALGTAVPVKVWERRLRTLKVAGVNAIRMAHNPHMPELYDLCDRLGFLVQDEAFDEWEAGKNKWIRGWNVGQPGQDGPHEHFSEWAEADLRDMVRRDRNHPSVIMWSIGNEIDYPNDPYTHEVLDTGTNPQMFGRGFMPDHPHADRLGEVALRLSKVVKAHDPTRPVTAGLAAALIANEVGLADALDVVGYNYQEYRYGADHAAYPSRVLYGSENGMRREFWDAVTQNPFICGQFLWTGIDYLGEAGQWPTRSNGAGLLDLAGFPKPEYFYRQSLWAAEPMLYLGTQAVPEGAEDDSLWSHRQAEPVWSGSVGEMRRVNCFTNCESAELFLNGRSFGSKRQSDAADSVLWWDVLYEPGTLTCQGLIHDAVVAIGELKTCGQALAIRAVSDTPVLAANGLDVAHLEVTVVDAEGVPVATADSIIHWTLDGPAKLLGLESGDHDSHEPSQSHEHRVHHGRLLGYVQSTEISGTVTLRLTSPGLEEAVVILQVEN